jgi:hypothetical protein
VDSERCELWRIKVAETLETTDNCVKRQENLSPQGVCVCVYIYIYNDELLFAMEFTQGVLKCLVTIYASSFSRGGDILVCSAPFVAG